MPAFNAERIDLIDPKEPMGAGKLERFSAAEIFFISRNWCLIC
jgi:hypothetical protein